MYKRGAEMQIANWEIRSPELANESGDLIAIAAKTLSSGAFALAENLHAGR